MFGSVIGVLFQKAIQYDQISPGAGYVRGDLCTEVRRRR